MAGRLRELLRRFNRRYFPCYVFSFRPLVLAIYDSDFVKFKTGMLNEFRRYGSIRMFLQLGYERESDETFLPLAREIIDARRQIPQLRVTVLANTPGELSRFSAAGIETALCHQNAFLDERRYPLFESAREFDAVYVARFTPCKHHELARLVPRLYLIGDELDYELDYADGCRSALKHARIVRYVPAPAMSREMARAGCGLCLSDREGAMFVSAEYLLSGIPVVDVPNLGGRNELFDPAFVRTAEPTAEAVAAAVEYWGRHPSDPREVRMAVLRRMAPHRERFRELLSEALGRPVRGRLPHKLGLRRTLMVHELLRHGLKLPALAAGGDN